MINREIRQAIDACRPGTDDLQFPEMGALREAIDRDETIRRSYERSQCRDAAMAQAFRDVPLPAGLEQRLQAAVEGALAAAGSAPARPASPAGQDLVELPTNRSPETARPGRSVRWRRIVLALGGLAAAVAVAAWIGNRTAHQPPDVAAIVEAVHVWTQAAETASWNDDLRAAALGDYPLDAAIRGTPQRWAAVATAYDAAAVVYDLSPPGQAPALVFCLRLQDKVPGISSLAPPTPDATSGGLAIGVWQQDSLLYALSVAGGEQRYRAYVGSTELIAQWPAVATSRAGRL